MQELGTTSTMVDQLQFDTLILVGVFVLLYVIYFWDTVFLKGRLKGDYGMKPRQTFSAIRFISHAFLHGNRTHLFGNSLPLLMMGGLALLFEVHRFWLATLLIIILSGLGTWVFGAKNTIHIGASSLIFGYFGFNLTRGIFGVNRDAVLLALVMSIVYSGFFRQILPKGAGVSRTGHFFGFMGGILTAWVTAWLQTNYPL